MTERIIKIFRTYDTDTMIDSLSKIAGEVEDSLIQCGATPGHDYTYKDVFDWAVSILTSRNARTI